MDMEDLLAALECRARHHHLAVEAAGASRAGSRTSGGWSRDDDDALVGPKPSISTRSWFSVCSRRHAVAESGAGWRPTASISSMKTMQGRFSCLLEHVAHALARRENTEKSDPEM